MPQLRIPAVYMRGGTSKGVFFCAADLPADHAERDRILLRVIGSPDPYGQHIDGMGGATSSTSKVVILAQSSRPDCDVDYLFGAVSIAAPVIDWSGNCGNLSAAVGPFALHAGLVAGIADGVQQVRIWQANLGKRIIAHIAMRDGQVVEQGDFMLDGVAFPAAEIKLEFLDPGGAADDEGGAMFPTGNVIDVLDIPGVGTFEVSLINAGNPAIFIEAKALGLQGNELQAVVNGNPPLLALCETIRAHGALAMGLVSSAEEASAKRPHTPKLAFVSAAQDYLAADGKPVSKARIDLTARILSMGKLHHAMTGTGAVAIAVAAAIPGTIVARTIGQRKDAICFGHPSGTLSVGATAQEHNGEWTVVKALMSRSARRLMEGAVLVNLN